MARNRDYDDGDFEQPKRSSPYQDMSDDGYEDEYDDGYDDEEYASSSVKKGARKGSGNVGGTVKLLGGVIVLLVVILIALVIVRAVITNKKNNADTAQPSASVDTIPEQTTNPAPIVFGPVSDATTAPDASADDLSGDTAGDNSDTGYNDTGYDDTGYNDTGYDDTGYDDTGYDNAGGDTGYADSETPEPVIATAEPTATPGATDTPLPIILTNTPTPTPEPTATPTPSPSPTPSPTPEPTPTPVADIGTGTVNRDAKLRADAAANAKVKKTIKKGESVTIHEAKTDSTGKLWYYLTVDDSRDEGWMRDYVVTAKLSDSAAVSAAQDEGESTANMTASAETAESGEVIATGKTNRAANLRQTMGGKVLVQLKKGTKINVYEQLTDSKGNVWYKAQAQNGVKVGYLRDYVVTLDNGVSTGSTDSGTTSAAASTESLQDREVIGKATTNRAANVREEPLANAKVVRQLGNGMELQILAKYAGVKEEIWYEVVTASGKTYGFVRDYVVYVTKLDKDTPTLTYEK